MGAQTNDDRLPWLDPPRPARPVPAARRVRTALLMLLGLFLASAIALMAFLIGRSTVPVALRPPVERVARASAPVPVPASSIAPPVYVATTKAPPPAAEVPRTTPARPRAVRPKAKPITSVPRSSARRQAIRPARDVVIHRDTLRPRAVPSAHAALQRRTVWPARPFSGPRGRVIQLGAYTTQPQADAAWWRVARAYPYLTSLPRMVTWIGPSRGRPRYYRVRLAAGSNREARALCRHLHRIGRGCIIA